MSKEKDQIGVSCETKEYNGRTYRVVGADHRFMKEAALALEECAGNRLHPIGAVLVKDGEVVARAGNGFNRQRDDEHICPRVVEDVESGTNYEMCGYCSEDGHVEPMLVQVAQKNGIDTEGADVYMYGHWWCCESCWEIMESVGIDTVYLPENAENMFANVRAENMELTIESVYIAGALTHLSGEDGNERKAFYEAVGDICCEIGCDAYVPHLHTGPESNPDASDSEVYRIGKKQVTERDVTVAEVSEPSHGTGGELVLAAEAGKEVVLLSKKGAHVSRFVTGNPAVVYHLWYDTLDEVAEKLPRILKML